MRRNGTAARGGEKIRATVPAARSAAPLFLLVVAVAWPVARADTPVTLAAVGDLSFALEVGPRIDAGGFDPFAGLDGELARADLAFGNLETVLSARPQPAHVVARPGIPILRGPLAAIPLMQHAGIDVVSVANNHAFDVASDGLVDTVTAVRAAGIATVGGGADTAAAAEPHVVTVRGLRVGFLAFAQATNHRANGDARIALLYGSDPLSAVRALRPQVDVLLVSLHWGEHYEDVPTSQQVRIAHRLIDAGADAILGHHPHVLQSVEVYHHRPIVYSLGNFVFSRQPTPRNLSAIFALDLVAGARPIARASLVPVVLRGDVGSPVVSRGREGDPVRDRLRTTSTMFGTAFTERDGALELGL